MGRLSCRDLGIARDLTGFLGFLRPIATETATETETETEIEIEIKGNRQECPLDTGFVYFFFDLERNKGAPQALAARNAPKRMMASMLERPSRDQ
jgi:hypothetical protein